MLRITKLLALRIYLEDKRFAKESLFINIWAGIAALLLQSYSLVALEVRQQQVSC